VRGSSSDTGLSLGTRFLGGNTIDFGAVLLTAATEIALLEFRSLIGINRVMR
jgi:hypothetical protein